MEGTDTQALPVLPLRGGVVLPGVVVTLALEGDDAKAAVAAAQRGDRRVLLVPELDDVTPTIGVIALVDSAGDLPNGAKAAILRGLHRAALRGALTPSPVGGRWAAFEPRPDATAEPTDEVVRELRAVFGELAEQRSSRRLPEILRTVHEPGALADAVASWADWPVDRKLSVLEAVDVAERLRVVVELGREALAEAAVAERIRESVQEGMERQQREFLLRQQLAAIQKELRSLDGGEGGEEDDVERYRERVAGPDVPEAVRTAVEREIAKLERTSSQSPEQGWIRTWLDTVTELPWGERSEDSTDLATARAVLDADHTGLDDVKERLIEFLAVRKLREERGVTDDGGRGFGAILCLVGPPGVGKTSLGESVARALDRRFVRVALGGVRDEAEVRGHRRTYVGAQPGRLVRAIKEAGTMNPVVLLDEVDKIGSDWRGDPSSALLEVLDPAQNHTFRDHYLELDLDLSDVVFLATANVLEQIPGPLLDRMELVRLDGYTEDEKVVIARDHLLTRQLKRAGLRPEEVTIDDEALRVVVTDHTREAGVRSLERALAKLIRKVATKLASSGGTVHVTADDVRTYLGRARFWSEVAERTGSAGVATGLAVTGAGGDVLFVEASASPGEPVLTLTGQLGDVMKESAQIALTYVRAHAAALGVDPDGLERRFHLHVPAGAIPKDGPSAGVTMTTALVSLLTDRPVRPEVGMTGEVTLQGRVLPIGGVKQKVLAADRAGLTEVVLPERNGPDLEDVPEAVRERVTIHLVSDVADVLRIALGDAAPVAAAAAA